MIQDATFIHPNPGHANADEPRGNEAKKEKEVEQISHQVCSDIKTELIRMFFNLISPLYNVFLYSNSHHVTRFKAVIAAKVNYISYIIIMAGPDEYTRGDR